MLLDSQFALAAPPVFSQQAAPGNMNILIICGDENGTYTKCTSLDDRSLELHLRLDLGHHVTMMTDDTEAADMQAAADAADLVIVPESVGSTGVSTKLTATSTPVINMEAFLQDEFQFVDPDSQSVDPVLQREVPGAPLKTRPVRSRSATSAPPPDETDIVIVDPSHPLAAGLSGRVTVYTIPAEINWAVSEVLAPGVQSVAALPDYPEAQSIYFILPGDALFDGSPSPNLRISLFTENNNDLGTYHRMTEEGIASSTPRLTGR
ncbi:MAG: hypothetical protein CM1200mP25_3960 [Acidobacteriota bacterium]|nr:MAG: hypothetical protein CM1200mP25_3960 [Acidobacteriota bacterium]